MLNLLIDHLDYDEKRNKIVEMLNFLVNEPLDVGDQVILFQLLVQFKFLESDELCAFLKVMFQDQQLLLEVHALCLKNEVGMVKAVMGLFDKCKKSCL